MKVVIIGIGKVGQELAENLAGREGNQLALIDIDEKHCEHLGNTVDALVLCGDGTDPQMLKKARAAEADALVATTGSDAMNTVIAILGHRMGVKKIMVKLNDAGLRAACDEIGVSKVVTPKISAAADLLAALYGFERLDFSLVVRGGLRMVEMGAAKGAGRRISELSAPEGALIVSVIRGERVLVPRGRTKLEEDDVLLWIIENEEVLEKLKKLLQGEPGPLQQAGQ